MNVLSIGGSDPSSGAGIQSDVKTFENHDVYGFTVITAITSQNTKKISKIAPISAKDIKTQLESLSPLLEIKNNKSKVTNLFNSLSEKQKVILKNKKQAINLLHEKLLALNPSQILNRGYSITFNEKGEAVDDVVNLNEGQLVTTQLAKGKFKSRVEN